MVLYVRPLSLIDAINQTILQLLTGADNYVAAIFCTRLEEPFESLRR